MKATTRPNPPFDGRLMLTVESALREAWRLVNTRHDRGELLAVDEDRITLWIEEALYELREQASEGNGGIAGFDRTTFERVQRGAAMRDYTGTKISKQPDLIFRPVGRRTEGIDAFHDGHIVECKLLDEKSGKSIGLYASKGISRFVRATTHGRCPMPACWPTCAHRRSFQRTLRLISTVREIFVPTTPMDE